MTNDTPSTPRKFPFSHFLPPALPTASNSGSRSLLELTTPRKRPLPFDEPSKDDIDPDRSIDLLKFEVTSFNGFSTFRTSRAEDSIEKTGFRSYAKPEVGTHSKGNHDILNGKTPDHNFVGDDRLLEETHAVAAQKEVQKSGPALVEGKSLSKIGGVSVTDVTKPLVAFSTLNHFQHGPGSKAPKTPLKSSSRNVSHRVPKFSGFNPTQKHHLSSSRKEATTPISVRATSLYSEVSSHSNPKLEGGSGHLNISTGSSEGSFKKLSELAPKTPGLSDEWLYGEGGDSPTRWSPRKKKGGYMAVGQASRAAAILSSARTDHSLWLHSVSRRISQHQNSPHGQSRSHLAALLKPKMQLVVLEVFPFTGDEQKALLASCRLILPLSPSVEAKPGMEGHGNEISNILDADLEGLVYFSLHLHPPSAANFSHGVSTLRKKSTTKKQTGEENFISVFVPHYPADLSHIEKGMQIWVWDPYHEVNLPTLVDNPNKGVVPLVVSTRGEVQSDADLKMPERDTVSVDQLPHTSDVASDVLWDIRPASARDLERKMKLQEEQAKERIEIALICGRFAVVY